MAESPRPPSRTSKLCTARTVSTICSVTFVCVQEISGCVLSWLSFRGHHVMSGINNWETFWGKHWKLLATGVISLLLCLLMASFTPLSIHLSPQQSLTNAGFLYHFGQLNPDLSSRATTVAVWSVHSSLEPRCSVCVGVFSPPGGRGSVWEQCQVQDQQWCWVC